MPQISAWQGAWLCFLLAIPLRLYFFSGYVLGDDINFANSPLNVLESGKFDFTDQQTSRMLVLIPQILSFAWLPVSDFSYILPTFLFALGSHAISLFFVRTFLAPRVALLTSVFFLISPFETLASTTFAPDYMVAFFSLGAVWGLYHNYQTGRRISMGWGGVSLGCAFLVKFSIVLLLPVIGIAFAVTWKNWRDWLIFAGTFFLMIVGISLVYWKLTGNPFHWFSHRADPPWGHDVTGILGWILSAYPKYVLGYVWEESQFAGWMFGGIGWIALLGILIPCFQLVRRQLPPQAGVIILFGVYLVLFNFTPHKLDFTAFYSHHRIFRYLPQITPFLYIAAAYFMDFLWKTPQTKRSVFPAMMVLIFGFCLYQIPIVSQATRDTGKEGRAMNRFFKENPPLWGKIHGNFWDCERLKDMSYPQFRHWEFDCRRLRDNQEKGNFLNSIDSGYLITGGTGYVWYTKRDWVLNLSTLGFHPPSSWKLIFQAESQKEPWREEPLRIWEIFLPGDEQIVEIADPHFNDCLRRQVYPLRPQDGLDLEAPITRRLTRVAREIKCNALGILNVKGLEYFYNLEVLHLNGNHLETINVGRLKKLRDLKLGHNQLTEILGLTQLQEIQFLWLGYNQLQTIDLSYAKKLIDLRLDQNQMREIRGAEDFPHLNSLFLQENPHLNCQGLPFSEVLLKNSGCSNY